MTKTYTLIVERDPESGWLVGEVAELPGCYSQAPDMTAREANIREAIAVYLETAGDVEPAGDFVGVWRVEATV